MRPLHRPQTRAAKRWRLQRGVRVAKTPSQRVSEEERRLPSPRPAGQRLSRPEAARPAPRSSGKVFSLRLPPWCRFALGGPGTGPLCGLCPPEKRPAVGVCFHLRARRPGREEMAAPSRAALRPRCHQLPVGACWQDHVCEFGIFFSPSVVSPRLGLGASKAAVNQRSEPPQVTSAELCEPKRCSPRAVQRQCLVAALSAPLLGASGGRTCFVPSWRGGSVAAGLGRFPRKA